MTYATEKKVCELRREIAAMVTFKHCEYMNTVIADAVAQGHGNKLTQDWLRRFLLENVEDGFITYGQALTLAPIYTKAIEALKMI